MHASITLISALALLVELSAAAYTLIDNYETNSDFFNSFTFFTVRTSGVKSSWIKMVGMLK